MSIVDYVVTLGFDAGKDYFKDRIDDNKLRAKLVEYTEKQQELNEVSTLSEEFDFQGLVDYISKNLLSDVEHRLFSTSKSKRRTARQNIIDKSCLYAKAETDEAKHRVTKCISICLDNIHDFYSKRISKSDYTLAADVVDDIGEKVDDNTQKVISEIRNASLFSIDRAVKWLMMVISMV